MTLVRITLIGFSLGNLCFSLVGQTHTNRDDELGIRNLIQQRQESWNSGDVNAYGRLLTEDADLFSATGRLAEGRRAILDLYVAQRAGAYKGAQTATPIESIRSVSKDVAIVNSRFQLSGLRATDGSLLGTRRGLLTIVVVKRKGRWFITCMRGIPDIPIR
jgi:uncharacterized protein (TIGR02246 family)